ncbi:VirB3 family type IV secretion system protein [Paraburkholderia tropica]|uniref:VirB3 family type IV secretion system protein n=1 Tax=Paraburkholderia tropica TaxID=92647 RepID=UPI002AB63F68|nr:VirB3 family type IV secretion system protein [Paraburkholderia tropica]
METTAPLEVDVDKELIESRLTLGIDRRFLVMIVMLPFMLSETLHSYWFLVAILPGWTTVWFATRDDVNSMDIYLKYRRQGDVYEPRQVLPQRRNLRPDGFARGQLC